MGAVRESHHEGGNLCESNMAVIDEFGCGWRMLTRSVRKSYGIGVTSMSCEGS